MRSVHVPITGIDTHDFGEVEVLEQEFDRP